MPSRVFARDEKYKEKLRVAAKRRWQSLEERSKQSGRMKAYFEKHPEIAQKCIENMNNAWKGESHSKEAIEKIKSSLTGRTLSPEHVMNISIAQKEAMNRPEVLEKVSGENNHNWSGGSSNLPYPIKFNEELKESIRGRDNHICQLCGKLESAEEEELGRKLAIHHIDYDKNNCDPENLLSLCGGCNSRVNWNREYWTKFINERRRINGSEQISRGS